MVYKIKLQHKAEQNKGTVAYIERLRWKKEKNAVRYRDNFVPNGEVVKT